MVATACGPVLVLVLVTRTLVVVEVGRTFQFHIAFYLSGLPLPWLAAWLRRHEKSRSASSTVIELFNFSNS